MAVERLDAASHLTMRCSGRRASARRLQGQALARTGCNQQAARRLRAAADRGRYTATMTALPAALLRCRE